MVLLLGILLGFLGLCLAAQSARARPGMKLFAWVFLAVSLLVAAAGWSAARSLPPSESWKLAYPSGVAGGLLVYLADRREKQGKLRRRFEPGTVRFRETMVSGRAGEGWWKHWGLRNALDVVVTGRALVVRPIFPVSLLFPAAPTPLDQDVPLERVLTAQSANVRGLAEVTVEYRDEAGDVRRLILALSRGDELAELLGRRR